MSMRNISSHLHVAYCYWPLITDTTKLVSPMSCTLHDICTLEIEFSQVSIVPATVTGVALKILAVTK